MPLKKMSKFSKTSVRRVSDVVAGKAILERSVEDPIGPSFLAISNAINQRSQTPMSENTSTESGFRSRRPRRNRNLRDQWKMFPSQLEARHNLVRSEYHLPLAKSELLRRGKLDRRENGDEGVTENFNSWKLIGIRNI